MVRRYGADIVTSTRALFTDPANLITHLGLVLGVSAIYAALREEFELSVLLLLIAFVADYIDGPVARRASNRPANTGELGAILDSVADVVCHSVAPAMILAVYGGLEWYLLPVIAFFVVAGAARMTRNTVDGGFSPTRYRGLSSDNNIVILVMVFLTEPLFKGDVFTGILAVTLALTGALNLSVVPVPKITGRAYYGVAIWTILVATVIVIRLIDT